MSTDTEAALLRIERDLTQVRMNQLTLLHALISMVPGHVRPWLCEQFDREGERLKTETIVTGRYLRGEIDELIDGDHEEAPDAT